MPTAEEANIKEQIAAEEADTLKEAEQKPEQRMEQKEPQKDALTLERETVSKELSQLDSELQEVDTAIKEADEYIAERSEDIDPEALTEINNLREYANEIRQKQAGLRTRLKEFDRGKEEQTVDIKAEKKGTSQEIAKDLEKMNAGELLKELNKLPAEVNKLQEEAKKNLEEFYSVFKEGKIDETKTALEHITKSLEGLSNNRLKLLEIGTLAVEKQAADDSKKASILGGRIKDYQSECSEIINNLTENIRLTTMFKEKPIANELIRAFNSSLWTDKDINALYGFSEACSRAQKVSRDSDYDLKKQALLTFRKAFETTFRGGSEIWQKMSESGLAALEKINADISKDPKLAKTEVIDDLKRLAKTKLIQRQKEKLGNEYARK